MNSLIGAVNSIKMSREYALLGNYGKHVADDFLWLSWWLIDVAVRLKKNVLVVKTRLFAMGKEF